jgi:hypothetical protein
MRQALREIRDFPGVTGKLAFDETGGAKRDVQILTIKDGQIQEAPPPSEKPPETESEVEVETSGRP